MHRVRSLLVLALASSLTALGLVVASPGTAVGNPVGGVAPACSVFDDPIYRVVKSNDVALLTPWRSEASGALANYGFGTDDGEVFKASVTPGPGLVEVHRLYRPWPQQDFLDTADEQAWTGRAEQPPGLPRPRQAVLRLGRRDRLPVADLHLCQGLSSPAEWHRTRAGRSDRRRLDGAGNRVLRRGVRPAPGSRTQAGAAAAGTGADANHTDPHGVR